MAKRTALFYMLIGMIWIIFSDLAVESLLPSITEMLHFSIVKGLFFILVTAGLLYLYVKTLENQRAKDQRNYRSLFVHNPNAMLITRKGDGKILAANQAAADLYGFDREMLKTMHHHELEVIAPGIGVMKLLKQHRHQSGSIIWVKEFVSEIEQETGPAVVHFIVSAHEAVEAEAARMATQERLERLLQGMPDMVLGIGNDRKINFLNPALLQYLQVNEQEVIGANALQVLRRRNGDWWESLLEKAWQEPRYITEHFDAPKKQWLRISSYQSPDGLGMLISDITQQHLLEDTLNQFEFTIEAVVNASDDWIWAINPDRKLLAANRRFYEATQTKHNDYLLQDSLLANRPDAPWFEEWKMMYAGAFAGHKMERLMHHPASLHESPTIDLRMYPIKNEEGKVVCVGCFAHDASRRIQHEQQLHSQQKKLTEIAWEQSHEIRAPLANILGIIQLIEQDQALSQTEVRHYLYELNMAACQLDAVIRKIVAKTGNVAS